MVLIFPTDWDVVLIFLIQTIPHPQESFLLCSYALFSVCFFKNLNYAFQFSYLFPTLYHAPSFDCCQCSPDAPPSLNSSASDEAFISGKFYLFFVLFSCCLITCLQEFGGTVCIYFFLKERMGYPWCLCHRQQFLSNQRLSFIPLSVFSGEACPLCVFHPSLGCFLLPQPTGCHRKRNFQMPASPPASTGMLYKLWVLS